MYSLSSKLRLLLWYVVLEFQDAKLTGLLLKYFNKPSFKDWQLRIIYAMLETKNTLVVMLQRMCGFCLMCLLERGT